MKAEEDDIKTALAKFMYMMNEIAEAFQDPIYVMPPRAVTMVEEMNPKGTCDKWDMKKYFPFAQLYESVAKNRAAIMASMEFTVLSYEEVFYTKLRPLRREGCISHMYGDELGDHTWALTMENIVETMLEFREIKDMSGSIKENP